MLGFWPCLFLSLQKAPQNTFQKASEDIFQKAPEDAFLKSLKDTFQKALEDDFWKALEDTLRGSGEHWKQVVLGNQSVQGL